MRTLNDNEFLSLILFESINGYADGSCEVPYQNSLHLLPVLLISDGHKSRKYVGANKIEQSASLRTLVFVWD